MIRHRRRRRRAALRVAVCLAAACLPGRFARAAELPPTAEFETPYAVRVLPGGRVVEIAGSFSWAVPQAFMAVLVQAPGAQTVRLDSPGGHVKAALEVASMIRARGLDTDVRRLCASACTLAYLGGRHRYLAPEARLGFHQGSVPGQPAAGFDAVLRQAYQAAGVPDGFIAHVLRTPPQSVWFPNAEELRSAGFAAGPVPLR